MPKPDDNIGGIRLFLRVDKVRPDDVMCTILVSGARMVECGKATFMRPGYESLTKRMGKEATALITILPEKGTD